MPSGYKCTQEEFIERAKAIHGDKYDYSQSVYVKMHKNLIVICSTHGPFEITPHHHLRGYGCPYCAGTIHTAEWAIQRAKEAHGDKYEYRPFHFVNNKSEMNIVCHIHGLFHRTVKQHVNEKNGCPKCCKTTKMTHEDFLLKARAKHGDKYEYLDEYVNSRTPMRIRCKKHDYVFEQVASGHLQGQGCPKCGREIVESSKRLTLEDFIKRGNTIHKDKYDYSLSVYVNGETKTKIICPIHGVFEQTTECHLSGQGCPKCSSSYSPTTDEFKLWFVTKFGDGFDLSEVDYKNYKTPIIVTCDKGHRFKRPPSYFTCSDYGCPICGNKAIADTIRLTKEEFVFKARETHGWKYGYDEVEYKGAAIPVKIQCPIHGDFWQKPLAHTQGSGCPKCNESKGERDIRHWLDIHNVSYIGQFKVNLPREMSVRTYLKIDFYVPKYNIFIEFHGKQHYEYIPFFHRAEDSFAKQQERDAQLRKYCKQHKIKLIEIPYTELSDIDKILDKEIGRL